MRHEVSGDPGFFLQYCDYLVSKIQHNQVSSKKGFMSHGISFFYDLF